MKTKTEIRHVFLNRQGAFSILTDDGITGSFGSQAAAIATAALDPGVREVRLLNFDTGIERAHGYRERAEQADRRGDYDESLKFSGWAQQLYSACIDLMPAPAMFPRATMVPRLFADQRRHDPHFQQTCDKIVANISIPSVPSAPSVP